MDKKKSAEKNNIKKKKTMGIRYIYFHIKLGVLRFYFFRRRSIRVAVNAIIYTMRCAAIES